MNIKFKDGWIAKNNDVNDKPGDIYYHFQKPEEFLGQWVSNKYRQIDDILDFDFLDIDWKDSLHQIVDGEIIKYIEKPDFKLDDLILVSQNNKDWNFRYFAEWEGKMAGAWVFGTTSKTITTSGHLTKTHSWKYYKKYTE